MKRCSPRHRAPVSLTAASSGFTLLEVAIYVAIAAIMGGPIITLVVTSTKAVSQIDVTANLQERNRTALNAMQRDAREAIGTSLLVTSSGRGLRFTLGVDFDGAAVVAGDTIEYLYSLSPGEAAGGLDGDDDDGNALADDGILVRRNLTTGEAVMVCAAVDMSASGFSLSGTAATINLTSIGVVRGGAPLEVSSAVTVYAEN
jgi:type II secretory pathway pseudopilin PulG